MKTEKRIPKGELKLNMTLNDEQKEVVSKFYENSVNFILGDFGTGKTSLCVNIGLRALQKKQYEKIIFCRPVLQNKILGFLPGDLETKLEPYVSAVKYLLKKIYKPNLIEKYIEDGKIVFEVMEMSKGKNYENCIVFIDEFTDLDYTELRNILTRIGKNSKIVFSGSEEQIDRSMTHKSCIHMLNKIKNNNEFPEDVAWSELKISHRNDTVYKLVKVIDKYK